jgi:hypothetical protein
MKRLFNWFLENGVIITLIAFIAAVIIKIVRG